MAGARNPAAREPSNKKCTAGPSRRDEDAAVEASALRDLRQRATLGPTALPSACCYTFHNAQDTYGGREISRRLARRAGWAAD